MQGVSWVVCGRFLVSMGLARMVLMVGKVLVASRSLAMVLWLELDRAWSRRRKEHRPGCAGR